MTPPIGSATPALSEPGRQTLVALCLEAWRSEIARRSAALTADPRRHDDIFGPGVGQVSRTQLALIRDLLPGLAVTASRPAGASGPAEAGKRTGSTAREQLDRIVDPARRRAWPPEVGRVTGELLTSPSRVWDLLHWSEVVRKTGLDPDGAQPDELRDELLARLWPEAVSSLVLAALAARRRN
jgi:hypothetical protein